MLVMRGDVQLMRSDALVHAKLEYTKRVGRRLVLLDLLVLAVVLVNLC